MEFAAHQFKLNARQPDGATLRQHLQMAANATGRLPDELANAPDMPESMSHIWQFFIELHRTRTSNGYGENCLSYSEINSWQNLTETKLYPYELECVLAIDGAYMHQAAKDARKDK